MPDVVFSCVYFVISTYSCLINHSVKKWLATIITIDMAYIFIRHEPDHWLCLSLTDWLTHSRLVYLVYVTLACEDAYSKLVEVVTVTDVDYENRFGNSLLQIWKLKFGHKAKLLFRLSAQGLVRSLKLKFRGDFEAVIWSVYCCWCLVEVTKLNLGQDYEARFGQDFKLKFSQNADVWLRS